MKKFLLGICFSILLSGAAWAQENGETQVQPDASIEQYKDWALRCVESQLPDQQNCRLFQRLVLGDSNQVIMQVLIFPASEQFPDPQAVFILPLGLYLPAGVGIKVDDGQDRKFEVERCYAQGCTARLALDDDLLSQFRKGKVARIAVQEVIQQQAFLNVSLSGFSAGYRALLESVKQ